jgi:hypothetical protein
VGGWVESEFSDRLWLSFSLALAKPNNTITMLMQQKLSNSISCGHFAGKHNIKDNIWNTSIDILYFKL